MKTLTVTSEACRRQDSCFNCRGPSGEDVSGGYYEAGGSFLKLGLIEAFSVRGLRVRACASGFPLTLDLPYQATKLWSN